MRDRKTRRETARHVLWTDRDAILPHILEHRDCGVFQAVQVLCYDAGWTLDSYILGAFFNCDDLLTEDTK